MIERGNNYLLFDGDCGICTWSSELLNRIDRGNQFTIAPYQSFPESELREFGITYEQCDRGIQVITKNCRVYRGAFGINYFFWQKFPGKLLVGLIYLIPVLLLFEVIGYRIIADNRHRLSQWFGMKACLHQ
jgi:predicted DCC family thiol-disulfide oxidoreductase YuxK